MASMEAAQLASAYREFLSVEYLIASAAALLLYEYSITLSQETKMIWSGGKGPTTIFLLNRGMMLVLAVIYILQLPSTQNIRLTPHRTASCKASAILYEASYMMSLAMWTAFSSLRVYAVSGHMWHITVLTAALGLVPIGLNLSVFFTESFGLIDHICSANPRYSSAVVSRYEVVIRGCIISSDAVVLVATYNAVRISVRDVTRWDVGYKLSKILLRDGILFFIILLLLNVTSMILRLLQLDSGLTQLINAFTTIFISRIMLNLREAVFDIENHNSTASGISTSDTFGSTIQFREQQDATTIVSEAVPTIGFGAIHGDND